MGKHSEEPLFALEEKGWYGLTGAYSELQGVIEDGAIEEFRAPLSVTQWRVVQFVLDYYWEHRKPPVAVRIGRAVGIGPRQLREMFPAGAVLTVFRMAELELPRDFAGPTRPALPN